MPSYAIIPRTLVALAWTGVVAATVPTVSALRGHFHDEAPATQARGTLRPIGQQQSGPTVALDTSTALILVYSAKCSACKANTDNWLRLVAEARSKYPSIPIFVVASPQDSSGHSQVPSDLGKVFPEYLLSPGPVDSALAVRMLPATVIVKKGRVARVVYGVVGPRRQSRLLADLSGVR